nr:serine/arginine repetitive matrix protein 1-like [Penaeus vannamei]
MRGCRSPTSCMKTPTTKRTRRPRSPSLPRCETLRPPRAAPRTPGSPPPPAGPQGPMPPAPQSGAGGGAPRLVGPDNASLLSRQLGFIPIQEGAPQSPQPPQAAQPAPRHAERHHHHHHHKLSKKVKNHKSKVLLSGLMTCPGPGFKLLNITRDSKSGQGFGFSIKGGREAALQLRSFPRPHPGPTRFLVSHSSRRPFPPVVLTLAIHLRSRPRASHLTPLMSRSPRTAALAALAQPPLALRPSRALPPPHYTFN